MTALLQIEDLRIAYGSVEAIKGISLCLNEGEIVTVLAPTARGKHPLTGHFRTYYSENRADQS